MATRKTTGSPTSPQKGSWEPELQIREKTQEEGDSTVRRSPGKLPPWGGKSALGELLSPNSPDPNS